MVGAIATTAALFAGSALAGGLGSAVVVNSCNYEVHLCNVPASGGGHDQTDRVLKKGDTYTQQWTQLSNTMGWSIKLSKDQNMGHDIMQYEYTYHGDDIIWYDMSEVDGNPWRGNFEITADSQGSKCQPRQVAYRFATDDAYGMQDCPADSTITVTLCSGENGGAPNEPSSSSKSPIQYQSQAVSAAPSSSSSSPAPAPSSSSSSSASAAASYVAPAPYAGPASSSSQGPVAVQVAASKVAAASPTVASSSVKASKPVATTFETVTHTAYVTIDTTMTAWAPAHRHGGKRHAHHAHQGHN